jgi:biopolymer transport protein ExbD
LQASLDQRTGEDREQRIFVRADGAAAYRELMNVMNLLRDAGYLKIALVGLEDTGQANGATGAANPSAGTTPQGAAPATAAPLASPNEGARP